MMDRINAWFPVVLLALLAIVTVWLNAQVQPPDRGSSGTARHDPDYIVENLAATRFGPAGERRHTLTAKRVTHYPDDDTTHLDDAQLLEFSQIAPVTVTARTALVSSNGEEVFLHDNVKVVRAPYAKQSALTLETAYLHVIPDDDFAETDQPVRIYDADTVVTGIGLEFNNATRVVKILSNVRGTYRKPQQPR
jgi:lipopolysaccharide export system protein LptC